MLWSSALHCSAAVSTSQSPLDRLCCNSLVQALGVRVTGNSPAGWLRALGIMLQHIAAPKGLGYLKARFICTADLHETCVSDL